MAAILYSQMDEVPLFERALKNTIVSAWNELMPTATAGVVQIEYHTGREHFLEYLKIWTSSERGYWNLVCEYWTCSLFSHVPGYTFEKGYSSTVFASGLESVIQHENAFTKLLHQDGSIQIYPPTECDRTAAQDWMTGAR